MNNDFFNSLNLEISEGRFPRQSEKYSVVIGPEAAKNTFDKEIPVGGNIYIKDIKFKVVGILESIGNPEDDKMMIFNIDTLRDLYDEQESIGYMDVIIVEGYDMEIAEENLKITLENKLGEDSVNVIAPTQLLEQVSSILDIIKYTLGGIAFVALIVGAIGIINTMFVIITEKTREIGIMKSIGATNEDILFMYVFQAGLFGFLGAILGVILGSFAAIGFEYVAQQSGFSFLEISIKLDYVVYLLLFGIIIGVISGYVPARKASKINIIEAIRK
jgi:putative ABC transport system permease protein